MILIIVESPAKAKKIQKYVGDKYVVKSSYGHFIELNTKLLDKMLISFDPIYQICLNKTKVIKDLKSVKTKEIILAADDDREGDAIAWHCGNLLKVDFNKQNRIIFNEISNKSIKKALENPINLNLHSVNAQRARQLIDLMIGFKLSPLLWKHIKTDIKGLSAGRVQSCLLRILIDHETTINNFKGKKQYKINGEFKVKKDLVICQFISLKHIDKQYVLNLYENLKKNRNFSIQSIENKIEKKYPPPPFITSSLQQSSQNELGLSIVQTMSIAQKLYENGKITYMRTDSTFISEDFHKTLKEKIISEYGENYYKKHISKIKVKGAQEAHEAIRPTNINEILNDKYNDYDKRLYNLIKKRTIVSNMKPAEYSVYTYILSNKQIDLYGNFNFIKKFLIFKGFLIYQNNDALEEINTYDKNEIFELITCECKLIEENPPQYLNESSIVKRLEMTGIGRPSTYASIVNTLYNRNYTEVKNIEPKQKKIECITLLKNNDIKESEEMIKGTIQKKRIIVTPLGHEVLTYLLKHFSNIINIKFTSEVELDLDKVSNGTLEWKIVIKKIYDSFITIVNEQSKFKNLKKNDRIYLNKYTLKKGQYGYYLNDGSKNYNLKYYLNFYKLSIDKLEDKHIKSLVKYPKQIGTYKNKNVIIKLGPYGYYIDYNNNKYKVKSKNIKLNEFINML